MNMAILMMMAAFKSCSLGFTCAKGAQEGDECRINKDARMQHVIDVTAVQTVESELQRVITCPFCSIERRIRDLPGGVV